MKERLDTLAALAVRAMFDVDEAEKSFSQAWLPEVSRQSQAGAETEPRETGERYA
jgi:hypothetical protein